MLITIQKPYFWQTVTAKEKDFFIGSLVKIYRKYTGGNEPQLSGFTERELAEFSTSAQRSSIPQSHTPQLAASELVQARPPYRVSDPKGPNGDLSFDGRPASSGSTGTRGTDPPERFSTPSGLGVPDTNRTARPSDPNARVQNLRKGSSGQSPRPDFISASTPRDDQSARTLTTESSIESLQSKPEAQTPPPPFANVDRFKQNGTHSPLSRSETPTSPPVPGPRSPDRSKLGRRSVEQNHLPERKRPPLASGESTQVDSGKATPVNFITPNETPSPAVAVKEQQSSKAPGLPDIIVPKSAFDYFSAGRKEPSESEGKAGEGAGLGPDGQKGLRDLSSALSDVSSPEASQTLSPDEGAHRPGLGPMIKKRSPKEIASVFRKAATAHNAFKPRTGGAADKIREEAAKLPNTPDGINGVFPAPARETKTSLPQPTPSISVDPRPESPPPANPADLTAQAEAPRAPKVTIETPKEPPEKESPEKKKDSLMVQEERRVRRPSNNSAKFAKALGVDPSMLEGRTAEIETVLNDLGWSEVDKKKKTFEDLHADLRRDLARVETGSWLGGFEQNDERIGAVGRLLDRAIAECEELDGVLTLYNVELGVRTLVFYYS